MPDCRSALESSLSWTDRAIQYAKEFGWQIVPLQASLHSSPSYAEDPVEKQLGSFVHVEYPEEATSDPEELRKLGTHFPVALIGAVTGHESDLLAVEVEPSRTDAGPLRERIESMMPHAPRVLGTNREYILVRPPETNEALPSLSRKEGIVLHGEHSIIRLPWRYYKWSVDAGPLQRADEALLSLFEEGAPELASTTNGHPEEGNGIERRHNGKRSSRPDRADDSDGHRLGHVRNSLFRSGEDLRPSSEPNANGLTLPWTVAGGLSVLTAPPKTGASTWVLNLAAHLAAGQSFLKQETAKTEVIMLADTSPSHFQRRLLRFGLLPPEALSRLHVLHARDVQDLDWRSTLERAYQRAEQVGARLIVIDDLDRYVRLKGGGVPTAEEEVVHALTAESPPDCAVLAVKSTECEARESISQTVARLGLLGRAADTVLRLDDVSQASVPPLRRLVTAGGTELPSQVHHCVLRRGRYERVQRGELATQEEPSAPPAESVHQFASVPDLDPLPRSPGPRESP